jgi:hypothetical protein
MKQIQIQTYMLAPGFFKAVVVAIWAVFTAVMTSFGPTLRFMQNHVSLVTGGQFSDQGPTREQAATTGFTYWMFGRAWRTRAANADETPAGEPDQSIVVRCDGPGECAYNLLLK